MGSLLGVGVYGLVRDSVIRLSISYKKGGVENECSSAWTTGLGMNRESDNLVV